jgi:hypothetical protein
MKNPFPRRERSDRPRFPALYAFDSPNIPLRRKQVKILRQWTAHLRANPDKQGHDRLTTTFDNDSRNDLHCCLGVLCEMAVGAGVIEKEQTWEPSWVTGVAPELTVKYGARGDVNESGVLPYSVLKWAGLPHNSGLREGQGSPCDGYASLSALNDGDEHFDRKDFAHIADAIDGWIDEYTK